jgi:hypothetical protein
MFLEWGGLKYGFVWIVGIASYASILLTVVVVVGG